MYSRAITELVQKESEFVDRLKSEVAKVIVGQGVMSLMLGREPAKRSPRVDRGYQPDRSLWPRLAGTYRAREPQNTVPGPLPIVYEDGRLHAATYPGDEHRRPGNIDPYPTGDLRFVLLQRKAAQLLHALVVKAHLVAPAPPGADDFLVVAIW